MKMDRFSNTLDTQRHLRLMRSVLTMSTTMGKDIHVVSMDVEAIAAIKKNSKNNNTKGCVKVMECIILLMKM